MLRVKVINTCTEMNATEHIWWLISIGSGKGLVTVDNKPFPDNKIHGANTGPTWVLSAPDGPHVLPMNLAIRDYLSQGWPRAMSPNGTPGHNDLKLTDCIIQLLLCRRNICVKDPVVMLCLMAAPTHYLNQLIFSNGPLTRYGKLLFAHAPGMPGTFSPPSTSKETTS